MEKIQEQDKRFIAEMIEKDAYTVALLNSNLEDSEKHVTVLKHSHTKGNSLETTV